MSNRTNPIQRVNFIQQDTFVLTYRRMYAGVGAVAAVCLLLLGVQIGRIKLVEKKLARLDVEVKKLREERDKISKQISSMQGEMSARDFLANLFEQSPGWTVLLKELTAVMPRSLWLTRVKAPDRPDSAAPLNLQLNGRAEEAASIARFLRALNASSFFKNVVLSSSQQIDPANGVGYFFTIDVAVAPPRGKGL